MSKKIKSMKWQTVALEGFPIANSDKFEGFVGLEECTDYGMDKGSKTPKKNKSPKKRKASEYKNIEKENAVPNKKIKLSNGFIVESCETVTPSLTNDVEKPKKRNNKRKNKKNKKNSTVEQKPDNDIKNEKIQRKPNDSKKQKIKLGETQNESNTTLTPEDMLSWAEFKLPEEIIKALMELGFKQPTKIQQLSLPAAIHGRRDILGAAETGSGKTLAFGLPILTGILKLKEKASLKNLDVYDIPFKKPSAKKQAKTEDKDKHKQKRKGNKKKDLQEQKENNKDSSEDGYGSGHDSNEDSAEENDATNEGVDDMNDYTNESNDSGDDNNDSEADNDSSDDFIEEIDVPLKKKREESADEGNDSDSEYVHLSEMLDSDDLASSDAEGDDEDDDNLSNDEQDCVVEVDAERTGNVLDVD
ncbi:ATP-dependent RNA helicase DDX24-like [Zerene cesonia]|uniref:ATP-dependent RNA helicase DDX24-like n=1 Tax=Zerene cesonia TaxID=33412 RepID=UPI0018E58060|nr:ATP-dependent RNA helicase DDX24-like [Zerene cesonia]